MRRARPEDFASLRLVIVGAEKLRKQTAEAFEEKWDNFLDNIQFERWGFRRGT